MGGGGGKVERGASADEANSVEVVCVHTYDYWTFLSTNPTSQSQTAPPGGAKPSQDTQEAAVCT